MKSIALITGATSGIGEATSLLLAKNNYDDIITGRREEKLDLLNKKIQLLTHLCHPDRLLCHPDRSGGIF